ncbi:MAG: VIT domain-containing protein [Gemmatimonadota bacterium]
MSRSSLALVVALALIVPCELEGQGWIEREGPVSAAPAGSLVARVGSTVRITLDGRIARIEVEELFRNNSRLIAEGSYLYPMPGEAVFSDFSLFQGDQELKGEMMNADKALGIYQEIVRRLKDPALLTLAGHGLVRAQVFPIQPGETRKIILRYTQMLTKEGNAWRVRYPLGARGEVPVTITATANGAGRLGVPYSPTHDLDWSTTGDRLTMRVEARPGRDFELLIPERSGVAGAQVLTQAPGGGERHFMLVVSPPVQRTAETLARDLVLVADVSGSMAGTKLEQTRAALVQALESLRAGDRFRVIAFSSQVTEFANGYTAVTRGSVRSARDYVERLTANGGTNIEGALRSAFNEAPGEGRMGIVLFLTDGLPSVGEESPEKLAVNAGARRGAFRVFPVGVGHDVNTYLLDRLAVEGRGRVEYVAPEANVETVLGVTLARLDAPVLTDLRIVTSPVPLLELAPARLPDLFAGEELVVMGRYSGTGRGAVVIEGIRNGRRERITAEASFTAHQTDNGFIAPLWAARRIGELTRQLRLEGSSTALVDRIRELGLQYGILTEYTSYLVLEPEARVAVQARRDMAPSAPAPSAQNGAEAFRRAERSAQLTAAKSMAASDEAVVGGIAGEADAPATRRVGGRMFVRRAGVWTDLAHADGGQVVQVKAFSQAYFDLVTALPEIRESLAVGDDLLIGGRRMSIRIGETGKAAWGSGELDRLVRSFRGA